MQQREAAVDASRQERRVLVVRLHDEAEPLEAAKVVGERQRDAGAALAERGIGDRIFTELVDEGDARIFDAPQLLREMLRIGPQRRLLVDDPAVDAVLGARRAQVRVAATILDAAQE